jgi:hypothetical protein
MNLLPPPIGLASFASAWMLLWGAAAAIPLVIHLLSRRARQVTAWAAMEFLKAALRKNSRRRTIEQWLLLALRTLILILLALAVAQPVASWWLVDRPPVESRGHTHTVLVLDASYSMGYRAADKTRFELAKQQARQIVAQGDQGDGFSLLLMADPPRGIVGDVAFDRADVQQEIDGLPLTHGGASLLATLEETDCVIQWAAARHPRLTQHRVFFLTDLGRTTWDEAQSRDVRERLGVLAERATLTLLDVGEADAANLAITRLAAGSSLLAVNDRVTFEVELHNFGKSEVPSQRVEMLVDGRSVAEHSLRVAAGGRATTAFSHAFDARGEHIVEARIDGDLLDTDNHRWLSVPVGETIQVLCVQGEQDAGRYVALALAPETMGRSRIRPELVLENALVELDLSRYDCVWLCNVGRFDREETNLLHRYVQRGGGLIVTLGDQVQADNYDQELGGRLSDRRVLPARLDRIMGARQYRFDPRDYQHPIVAPFRGHERSGLLTAPVWRYFRAIPYERDAAKIALYFDSGDADGGDPAIVEERIGQGRCILATTAFSLSSVDASGNPWTALPTWPCFPPLVHNLLLASIQGRIQQRNVRVGEPLAASPPAEGDETTVTVTDPAGRVERAPVRMDGPNRRWRYHGAEQSGVYKIESLSGNAGVQLFAANVDTRESDLARVDRASLPRQFSDRPAAERAANARLSAKEGRPLFRAVLGAMVILLLGEALLAWRIGGASA